MYISIFIHWYVFDISMFFYPFVHFFVCFLGVYLYLSVKHFMNVNSFYKASFAARFKGSTPSDLIMHIPKAGGLE